MKQYRVGLIRVLTTADPELLQLHGRLIEQYFPLLKVESRCIPDQPDGIHDDATMAMGGPKVVAMAEQMWKEGFEAIIVSCAGDPGVAEARKAVPIPMIGAGESTAALCMFYGSRPAALGITEDLPDGYKRIFGGKLVDNAHGDDVESVLDLMTPEGYAATAKKAQIQKKMGADVIALSCTGMSTIRRIFKKLRSPVMRQSFPAFRAAFSVALIPPFWRCRRSDRSHPSSAHRCIGGRAGFDLAHPVPQWPSADFQAGGS